MLHESFRGLRLKALAAVSALFIGGACGGASDDSPHGPSAVEAPPPAGRLADGGRDGSTTPPPRPVCFFPADPPTATARAAAADPGADGGADGGDAGAGARRVQVDLMWPVSFIHIESWTSTSGAVLLDTVSAEDGAQLLVGVPAGASEAELTLEVSCNPHLGARVSIRLDLTKDAVDVVVSVID